MLDAAIAPGGIGLQAKRPVGQGRRRLHAAVCQPGREVAARIEPNTAGDPVFTLQAGTATPFAVEGFARMDEDKLRRTRRTFNSQTRTRQHLAIDGPA